MVKTILKTTEGIAFGRFSAAHSSMNSRPRVLVISTNSDRAGAPLHVLELAKGLKNQFQIAVIFGSRGPVEAEVGKMGNRTFLVPSLRSVLNPALDICAFWNLYRLIRREQPDLIHAHSAKAGLIARLAASLLRRPCIYTVHGWGFGQGRPRIQSLALRIVETIMAKLSNCRFLFVSASDLEQGERDIGGIRTRSVVIRNGVPDHGRRAKPARSNTALMVARVAYQKDHECLLKAYSMATAGFPLWLVGEGTLDASFKEKVLRLVRPPKAVELIGPRIDVPDLLSAAGLVVLSSRYEGLPLSIIEAMCAGLPIVATDVGGVRELVIDGLNGFTVPREDPMTLCDRICRLVESPGLRQSMGDASRKLYEKNFSVDAMLSSIADEYRRALTGHRDTHNV